MGRPSTSTLTNCTPDGWPCPGGAKAAGPLFYRKLAALGMLCDLGRVLKQYQSLRASQRRFSRPGGLWYWAGKTPDSQAEAPQAAPGGCRGKRD